MAHAKKCPPSSADRWMLCTASVPLILQLIANGELTERDLEDGESISDEDVIEFAEYGDVILGDSESTSFSAEGTVMHSIRQMCLDLNLDPFNFVGMTMAADGFSFVIDDDKADRLVAGLDWIRQFSAAKHVEVRVDLSDWLPEQFGTCDTFWIEPVKRKPGVFDLYISDYKNGIGKPVAAAGNRQLRIYALGAWVLLGRPTIRNVILNIDQPRAGGMKYDEITFSDLMEFGEEVRRVWDRIERGDVEFVPTTSGCQFCPVKKTQRGCAAYNRWMVLLMNHALLDPSQGEPRFRDPEQMPRAMRYYIVKHGAAIRAWLAKLHEESLKAAVSGDPDPGSKAIEGDQGHRFFRDAAKAETILTDALGDAAYKPRQVVGITEIERLMKPGRKKEGNPVAWALLEELVDRPRGTPKLVPADHPKPALVLVDADDFDDL